MSSPGGDLYLGLDVGTQSTKGVLIDAATHEIVSRASRSYDLIAGLPPGAAEQHPQTWIDAVHAVAHEVLESVDGSRILGVGVSGQQHGLVVLDENDQVIRPAKLWCDTSTAVEARELSETLGRAVPTGFTASKITWLSRQEPEHWARTRRVLLPHDYVNLVLTGRCVMEAGDASGTGFFDSSRRCFDPISMAATAPGLDGRLPPLIDAGAAAGRLDERGAALLGLPRDILVAAGGGDNMMSAIGSGATRPGVVVMSLGTSGTVFTRSESPVIDPEGLIAPFCDSTGAWLPLLCVMNLTGVLEEVSTSFGLGLDELTEKARTVPTGCEGLMWLPYLQGERVPDLPHATGSLHGLRPGLLRPGHLFRAALEGTSLNLAWGVQRLRGLGLSIDSVRLVGGGASNPLWSQILADCIGASVELLIEHESAALGAAIQALWTHRRQEHSQLTIDEVARPFINLSAGRIEPDSQRKEHHASQLQSFINQVKHCWPH